MSDEQVLALWVMIFVGPIGFIAYLEGKHKAIRIAGVVWVVAWWLPPLAMLWIKGVFG